MEAVKKQADTITDLENELAKARKQERAYEEAMEQLQADLDALEQDNAKLKTLANNPERQASTAQVVEAEAVATEGNLETSYLLEQVRNCCDNCVDFRAKSSSLRSMPSVALSGSCAKRTRSSRAKTSSRRSRRCPSCLYPSRARRQRLRSYPRRSQTQTPIPTTNPGHHPRCARSQWSRNSSTARSSSTPRPRASSTCPCSRPRARTGNRRRRRGCRARRRRRTSSSSARCRASGLAGD